MSVGINRSSLAHLSGFFLYCSSKITFSHFVLSYAFLGPILTHSVIGHVYPTIGVIKNLLAFFLTFAFIVGIILNSSIYKNFTLYIDKYMVCVFLYVLSSIFSIFLHRDSGFISLALQSLLSMTFPLIASFAFIQILRINHIKTVGIIFIVYALINIIISFVQIGMYSHDLTQAHISAFFTDRNLLARFLVIVNAFVLTNYLAHKEKKVLDFKLLLLVVFFLNVTFLYSRSGYLNYFVSTFIIIWFTNNKRVRRFGMLFGMCILTLFIAMLLQRIKSDKMNIKNSSDLGRISVLKAGINMIKDNPIHGVGYGMAKHRFIEYEDKSLVGHFGVQTIHNIYIQVFAEQGIPGLLIYLLYNYGLLILLFKRIYRTKNIRETKNEIFCFVSLGIFMFHGLMYHTADYDAIYWIIIALCIIVLRDKKIKTPAITT